MEYKAHFDQTRLSFLGKYGYIERENIKLKKLEHCTGTETSKTHPEANPSKKISHNFSVLFIIGHFIVNVHYINCYNHLSHIRKNPKEVTSRTSRKLSHVM